MSETKRPSGCGSVKVTRRPAPVFSGVYSIDDGDDDEELRREFAASREGCGDGWITVRVCLIAAAAEGLWEAELVEEEMPAWVGYVGLEYVLWGPESRQSFGLGSGDINGSSVLVAFSAEGEVGFVEAGDVSSDVVTSVSEAGD